jgi:hypothetical protein
LGGESWELGTKQRRLDGGDVGRRLRGKERLAPPRRLSFFSRLHETSGDGGVEKLRCRYSGSASVTAS